MSITFTIRMSMLFEPSFDDDGLPQLPAVTQMQTAESNWPNDDLKLIERIWRQINCEIFMFLWNFSNDLLVYVNYDGYLKYFYKMKIN